MNDDRKLRAALRELHRTDAPQPFASMWVRAGRAPRRRRLVLVATAALVAVALTIIGLRDRERIAIENEPFAVPEAVARMNDWRAPTDALLEVPGDWHSTPALSMSALNSFIEEETTP